MRASYPTYKSTSIPWLPEMPEHWDALKAKHIFKERSEKGYPDEPLLAATQTKGVVRKEEYETRTVTAQKDFHLLKLVKEEDFVISLRSFQGGIEYAYHRGIISPAYTIFYERNKVPVNKAFYRHLFKSHPFINSLTLFVTGIREGQNIDYAEFKDSLLPFPPLPEQTAIANYLDAKTEQINRFIEKKEKLIALLKEQKQAVINELLEDKEGKWERRKLKYFCSLITKGTTPSTEGKEFTNSGVRFLKAENITENGLSESPWFFIDEATNQILKRSQLKANDILIVIAGATIGRTAIITESFLPANTNQAVCLLRLKKDVDPKFIRLLLSSPKIQERVRFDAVQSAQPNLSMGVLGDFLLPYPKLESERQQLVNTIEEESMRIDAVIQRITVEIEKVKELKQSLIAEVVTGRIKVV